MNKKYFCAIFALVAVLRATSSVSSPDSEKLRSAYLDQFSKVEWMLKEKHDWAVTTRDQADRAIIKAIAGQYGGISATWGWDLHYAVILPGDAGEVGAKGDVVLVGELVDQMQRFATKAIFIINARTGNTVVISDKTADKAPNQALEPTSTAVTPPASAGDRASGARGSS